MPPAVMAQSQPPPQDLSLARGVFTGALTRPEKGAPQIPRDDATLFAPTILRTCNICTAPNMKVCTDFIVKYILPSASRTAALVKYLVTLSRFFEPRDPGKRVDTTKRRDENEGLGNIVNGRVQQPPQPAVKRLHILYIVNDVLVNRHTHRSYSEDDSEADGLKKLRREVGQLAELTVSGCRKTESTWKEVRRLLDQWQLAGIFPAEEMSQIRDVVRAAEGTKWEVTLSRIEAREEARREKERLQVNEETKWILPEQHGVVGDKDAPWHQLPAANGLYMKRTRGYPMRAAAFPPGGERVTDGGKEADPELKKEVSAIYADIIRCFDKYTPAAEVQDIDPLGNIIWKDPERPTRNYWGYTLEGIDKRRALAARFSQITSEYSEYGPPNRHAYHRDRGRSRGRGYGFRAYGSGNRARPLAYEPRREPAADRHGAPVLERGRGRGMDRGIGRGMDIGRGMGNDRGMGRGMGRGNGGRGQGHWRS